MALSPFPATIQTGKKLVEARAMEANKSFLARWFLENYSADNPLVVAIGDDQEDEDLFASVPEDSITIKVGEGDSRAFYRIPAQEDVIPFLDELARISLGGPSRGGRDARQTGQPQG